jgi:hypothetical protein
MMQKAMRRKAEKNLDCAGTKNPSTSLINYSDFKISSNLGSVGVSLRRNLDDISVLANVLRHLEHDRLTVIPKVSTRLETPILKEDETDVISDDQLVSALLGSISEAGTVRA